MKRLILALLTVITAFSCNKQVLKPKVSEVIITIDDTPYMPERTEKILNIFEKYNIKDVTFFCVGEALLNEPRLANRIAKDHILANHTMTHPHLSILDSILFNYEVFQCQKIVDSINISLNKPVNNWFRPPYSDVTEEQIEYLGNKGLDIVWWNSGASDWKENITKKEIFDETMSSIELCENTPVILFHHGIYETLDSILSEFEKRDIEVVPLYKIK
jgi:peptidoglycan-N-acetylglucosamine deacetylase